MNIVTIRTSHLPSTAKVSKTGLCLAAAAALVLAGARYARALPAFGKVGPLSPTALIDDPTGDSEFHFDQSDLFPAVAGDGQGNWVAVWARGGTVMVARSSDDGATWQGPVALAAPNGIGGAFPDIATDRAGRWIVVWESDALPGLGGGYSLFHLDRQRCNLERAGTG